MFVIYLFFYFSYLGRRSLGEHLHIVHGTMFDQNLTILLNVIPIFVILIAAPALQSSVFGLFCPSLVFFVRLWSGIFS